MFRINNKGLSLVELLVALAIASIIIATASRFLSVALKQYSKDNYEIKLQTETEEMLNLLENWIMDGTNPNVGEGQNSITLDKKGTDGNTFSTNIYCENEKIYYTNQAGRKVYVGNYVKDITFEISDTGKAIFVGLNLEFGSASYNASRKILLRNEAGGTVTGDADETEDETTTETTADPLTPTQEEPTNIAIDVLSTGVEEEKKGLIASIFNFSNSDKYVTYTTTVKNIGSTIDRGKLTYRLYIYYQSKDGEQTLSDGSWSALIDGIKCNVSAGYHEIACYSLEDVDKKLFSWAGSFDRLNVHLGYIEFSFPGLSQDFKYNTTMNIELAYTLDKTKSSYFKMVMGNVLKTIMPDIYEDPQAVVYYEGISNPIWGQIPEDLFKLSFEIVNNTTTKNSDGSYTVNITVRKKGLDINWANVKLYYYWLDNNAKTGGNIINWHEYLKISNVKCSINTNNIFTSVYHTEVRPDSNNDKHAGSNGYVIFSFSAFDYSVSRNEEFVLSFDVKCDKSGYIDSTINEWFSYNNANHVYGVYSGKNSMTFGNQPTGVYVEKTEVSSDDTKVINNPQKNTNYSFKREIDKVVVEFADNSSDNPNIQLKLYNGEAYIYKNYNNSELLFTYTPEKRYCTELSYDNYGNREIKSVTVFFVVEGAETSTIYKNVNNGELLVATKPIKKIEIKWTTKGNNKYLKYWYGITSAGNWGGQYQADKGNHTTVIDQAFGDSIHTFKFELDGTIDSVEFFY